MTPNPVQFEQLADQVSTFRNDGLPLEDRIAGCTALLESDALPARMAAQVRVIRAELYQRFAKEIRETGNEPRASQMNRLGISDVDRAFTLGLDDDYSYTAYFIRGRNHRALRQWHPAIADYGCVIRLNPGMLTAHQERGDVLLDAGRPTDALADYDLVLAARPPVRLAMDAHFGRVLALCRAGRCDEIEGDIARSAGEPEYSIRMMLQTALGRLGYYGGGRSREWSDDAAAALRQWMALGCPIPPDV